MSSIVIPEIGKATLVSSLLDGELAIVIGRGNVNWGSTPPTPTKTSTSLIDPIGLLKSVHQNYVVSDDNGSIQSSNGSRWEISVNPTQHLYITGLLDFDDAAGEVIREYAIYLNPTIDDAVLPGEKYVPLGQVTDLGQLIGVKNIHPITRVVSRQTIGEIIEF